MFRIRGGLNNNWIGGAFPEDMIIGDVSINVEVGAVPQISKQDLSEYKK